MLATLTVAALVCVASVLVGEALARLLALDRWRGWSPAVGLAAILAVALATVKLPGHGDTGAVLLAVMVVLAAIVVAWPGGARPALRADALTVGATALLAALIPYVANGRFGVPAVGYTNDPAAHFVWISNLQVVPASEGVIPGYPVGPHSLMAAIASGTGIQIDWILSGLLVALPPLIGWTALSLLDGLGTWRRALAATLVAVAYTVSAFYAQAGFKELLLTLFLLASIAIARHETRRGAVRARCGIQIGLLLAAIVTSFSYGGLAWPILTAALWLAAATVVAAFDRRREGAAALGRSALRWLRRVLPAALAAAAVAALAIAADLQRLLDSLKVFGTSPAGAGSIETANVGHLAGEVSKREIFGFWPREDFRFAFDQTLPNELLGLLAIAIAVYGGLWWLWRRDLAVPAAVLAAVAIAVRLSDTESAYTASKALAPAGALVMLMSARALLDPPRIRIAGLRWAVAALTVVFVGSALWSSFLVLRGAHVGPREHTEELAALRSSIASPIVLFLGNDDYAQWELVPKSTIVLPSTRHEKGWEFEEQFDFDSLVPGGIDAAPFTITTRTLYRSEAPASLRRVRSTASYDLWRNEGPTPPREVLPGEGPDPGDVLDCGTAEGRALARRTGWARIWTVPPLRVRIAGDAFNVSPGERATVPVFLPAGRWELSLQYVSPQRVHVAIGDVDVGSVPANLERPGPVWRVGEVDVRAGGPRRVELHVEDDVLGATETPAAFEALALVRLDAPRRLVPLRQACGRYVDWYTLGPKRPAVPKRAE